MAPDPPQPSMKLEERIKKKTTVAVGRTYLKPVSTSKAWLDIQNVNQGGMCIPQADLRRNETEIHRGPTAGARRVTQRHLNENTILAVESAFT